MGFSGKNGYRNNRQGIVSTTTGKPQGEPGFSAGIGCCHPLQHYHASAMFSPPITPGQLYVACLLYDSCCLLPLGFCLLHSLCISLLLSILITIDSFWSYVEISWKYLTNSVFYHPLLVLRLSVLLWFVCQSLVQLVMVRVEVSCYSKQIFTSYILLLNLS